MLPAEAPQNHERLLRMIAASTPEKLQAHYDISSDEARWQIESAQIVLAVTPRTAALHAAHASYSGPQFPASVELNRPSWLDRHSFAGRLQDMDCVTWIHRFEQACKQNAVADPFRQGALAFACITGRALERFTDTATKLRDGEVIPHGPLTFPIFCDVLIMSAPLELEAILHERVVRPARTPAEPLGAFLARHTRDREAAALLGIVYPDLFIYSALFSQLGDNERDAFLRHAPVVALLQRPLHPEPRSTNDRFPGLLFHFRSFFQAATWPGTESTSRTHTSPSSTPAHSTPPRPTPIPPTSTTTTHTTPPDPSGPLSSASRRNRNRRRTGGAGAGTAAAVTTVGREGAPPSAARGAWDTSSDSDAAAPPRPPVTAAAASARNTPPTHPSTTQPPRVPTRSVLIMDYTGNRGDDAITTLHRRQNRLCIKCLPEHFTTAGFPQPFLTCPYHSASAPNPGQHTCAHPY